MINLQNPNIPAPIQAVEIDRAIYETQLILSQKLGWLTHDYGRAYRHLEKKGKRFYFPEVYVGGSKHEYLRVTPDSDKKGTCFFVVGKENDDDFEQNQFNYIKWDVGIVFWVNLGLINNPLSLNEIYTQNLIKEVREVLTRQLRVNSFNLKIKSVERELKEIYREFNLNEDEEYLRSPYSGFRFNCEIVMQEDCGAFMFDPNQALIDSISQNELLNILLPTIDFSIQGNFDSLTAQQVNDLTSKLCGLATVENSDQTWSETIGAGLTLVTPDIQFTDSDLQVYQLPSVKNIVAKPCPVKSGISYRRPISTGRLASFRNGDYGYHRALGTYDYMPPINPIHIAELDWTSVSPFITLKDNNVFGNKSRFTDKFGNQSGSFVNNYVIDNLTGLAWKRVLSDMVTWNDAIDAAQIEVFEGESGWRVSSVDETHSILDYTTFDTLNYSPMGGLFHSNNQWTSVAQSGANAYFHNPVHGTVGFTAATGFARFLLCRNHFN